MMTSPNPHPPFVGSGGLEGRSAAAGRSAQSLGGVGWGYPIRSVGFEVVANAWELT